MAGLLLLLPVAEYTLLVLVTMNLIELILPLAVRLKFEVPPVFG